MAGKNIINTPMGKVAYQKKNMGNFGDCLVVRTSMKILAVYEFAHGEWKDAEGKRISRKAMKELLKYGVRIA